MFPDPALAELAMVAPAPNLDQLGPRGLDPFKHKGGQIGFPRRWEMSWRSFKLGSRTPAVIIGPGLKLLWNVISGRSLFFSTWIWMSSDSSLLGGP